MRSPLRSPAGRGQDRPTWTPPFRAVLATRFGATATLDSGAEDGAERARELTGGLGFAAVIEAVGTVESVSTALSIVANGGAVGYVGVPHGAETEVDIRKTFYRNIAIRGGITPAPTSRSCCPTC